MEHRGRCHSRLACRLAGEAAGAGALERAADADGPAVEVDVFPVQAEEFPLPEAGAQGEIVQRPRRNVLPEGPLGCLTAVVDGNSADGCRTGRWFVAVVGPGDRFCGFAEGVAEEADGVSLEAESDVGVDGGGDADMGVAEEFFDHHEADALFQEKGRGRVPEIMEADHREFRAVEEAPQVAGQVGGVERPALLGGGDEPTVRPARSDRQVLRQALAAAGNAEVREVDVEAACVAYTQAGYEVTRKLREFLESYGEIVMGRTAPGTGEELVLTISVEEAMGVFPPNVRSYSRRLGMPVVPIGTALVTEENVLLAENGDIIFAGDAGMQRVGNGFAAAVQAFMSGTWDKTFF
ncbi:hypothetical protein QFZ58_004437 [Streptomyces sp. B1I3]|nr:hypothetical protein [Streptomyces sp. B1I3]